MDKHWGFGGNPGVFRGNHGIFLGEIPLGKSSSVLVLSLVRCSVANVEEAAGLLICLRSFSHNLTSGMCLKCRFKRCWGTSLGHIIKLQHECTI